MNRLNADPFAAMATRNVASANKNLEASPGLLTLESPLATPTFAEALRQQTQANQAPNKTQASAAKPQDPQRAMPPKNPLAKANSTQNPVNSSEALEKNAPAAAATAQSPATNAAATDTANPSENKADPAAPAANDAEALTPAERKKKLAKAAEQDPPADAALSPWMQTMIALRPNSTDARAATSSATTASLAADTPPVGLSEATQATQGQVLAGLPNKGIGLGVGLKDALALARATPDEEKGFLNTVKDFLQASADRGQVANAGAQATQLPANLLADPRQQVAEPDALLTVTLDQLTNTAADQGLSPMQTLANAPSTQALTTSSLLSSPLLSSPLLSSQISVPFGNERWQAAMNQHVMNMVNVGDEVASLTLSPPDLGPIQVVLNVDNQSVNTSFVTDNPVVRQALEDGMQDLRERMASQGLSLGNTFIGNGQQAEQHFLAQSPATRATDDTEPIAPETLTAVNAAVTRVQRGLVDIQV